LERCKGKEKKGKASTLQGKGGWEKSSALVVGARKKVEEKKKGRKGKGKTVADLSYMGNVTKHEIEKEGGETLFLPWGGHL